LQVLRQVLLLPHHVGIAISSVPGLRHTQERRETFQQQMLD
jgi:hypothetical protein